MRLNTQCVSNLIHNRFHLRMMICILMCLAVACSVTETNSLSLGNPIDIQIAFTNVPEDSGLIEVKLVPADSGVIAKLPSGENRTRVLAIEPNKIMRSVQLKTGEVYSLPVFEVNKIPQGEYQVIARTLDWSKNVIVYRVSQRITVAETTGPAVASTNDRSRNAPVLTIIPLARATGNVRVKALLPQPDANLKVTADIGGVFANISTQDENELQTNGTLLDIPSGQKQMLTVEARDPSGLLKYRAVTEVSVNDETKSIELQLKPVQDDLIPEVFSSIEENQFNADQNVSLSIKTNSSRSSSNIIGVDVDWGDGNRVSRTNRLNTEAGNQTHKYSQPGVYVISTVARSSDSSMDVHNYHLVNVVAPERPECFEANTQLQVLKVTGVPAFAEGVTAIITPSTGTRGRGDDDSLKERELSLFKISKDAWGAIVTVRSKQSYQLKLQYSYGETEFDSTLNPYTFVPQHNFKSTNFVFERKLATPTSGVKLQISPQGILFTKKNEQRKLLVRAYNPDGQEASLEAMFLEWSSSALNRFSLEDKDKDFSTITVKSNTVLGSGLIGIKSKNDPKIKAEPITATVAKLQKNVKTIADQVVVYPPPLVPAYVADSYRFKDISLPDLNGHVTIGNFSDIEISAMYSIPIAGQNNTPTWAVVLRDLKPKVGSILIGDGSAILMGKVRHVEQRGSFSLIQLEQVAPTTVFSDLDINITPQALIAAGATPTLWFLSNANMSSV
jgi:hypothetical protein